MVVPYIAFVGQLVSGNLVVVREDVQGVCILGYTSVGSIPPAAQRNKDVGYDCTFDYGSGNYVSHSR